MDSSRRDSAAVDDSVRSDSALMLVVGNNLRALVTTVGICDDWLVEEHSICIALDGQLREMRGAPVEDVVYGTPYDPDAVFLPPRVVHDHVRLAPGDRVLACSQQDYAMPVGYFGLVQTKGSLARLFVAATCNDGQVEPGYRGRITLELANFAPGTIAIPVGAIVAQLFLFRCSTEARPYNGRYQGATAPTIPNFTKLLT